MYPYLRTPPSGPEVQYPLSEVGNVLTVDSDGRVKPKPNVTNDVVYFGPPSGGDDMPALGALITAEAATGNPRCIRFKRSTTDHYRFFSTYIFRAGAQKFVRGLLQTAGQLIEVNLPADGDPSHAVFFTSCTYSSGTTALLNPVAAWVPTIDVVSLNLGDVTIADGTVLEYSPNGTIVQVSGAPVAISGGFRLNLVRPGTTIPVKRPYASITAGSVVRAITGGLPVDFEIDGQGSEMSGPAARYFSVSRLQSCHIHGFRLTERYGVTSYGNLSIDNSSWNSVASDFESSQKVLQGFGTETSDECIVSNIVCSSVAALDGGYACFLVNMHHISNAGTGSNPALRITNLSGLPLIKSGARKCIVEGALIGIQVAEDASANPNCPVYETELDVELNGCAVGMQIRDQSIGCSGVVKGIVDASIDMITPGNWYVTNNGTNTALDVSLSSSTPGIMSKSQGLWSIKPASFGDLSFEDITNSVKVGTLSLAPHVECQARSLFCDARSIASPQIGFVVTLWNGGFTLADPLLVKWPAVPAGRIAYGANGAYNVIRLLSGYQCLEGSSYGVAGTSNLTVRLQGYSNVDPMATPFGTVAANYGSVNLNGATPVDFNFTDLTSTDFVSFIRTAAGGTPSGVVTVAKTPGVKVTLTGVALDTSTLFVQIGT